MVRMMSVALALGLLVSSASAEEREKDVKKTDKPVEKGVFDEKSLDKAWLVAIHQCMNNQDNCLAIVERFASSEKVKEFAKDVKKDHDDLKKDLGTAVKDKKVVIVAFPDKEARTKLDELRKKEKEEFDKTFLTHFIEGHEKAIRMCENQKARGEDKDVTKLAEKMLPTLKDHVKKAKELKKELK